MTLATNANFDRLVEELKNRGSAAAQKASEFAEYQTFIGLFPQTRIKDLSLEEYALGKSKNTSFCWWLERGLVPVLGRYAPGTSRGHLLYYKQDGSLYKNSHLIDLSDEEALGYTLAVQSAIAAADPQGDLSWVDDDNQIYARAGVVARVTVGNGRKLRLLSAYHPDEVLPISSSEHLAHFLTMLGYPTSEVPAADCPVARMLKLLAYFTAAKERLPDLSTKAFMNALYSDSLGLRPAKEVDDAKTDAIDDDEEEAKMIEASNRSIDVPLNQILFGPPGTGKTFSTIDRTLEILDPEFARATPNRKKRKDRFDELLKDQRVRFVTFHQSFSYEDFVEGLRAVSDEEGSLSYVVEAGVFKRLCDDARVSAVQPAWSVRSHPRIWKISIDGTGFTPSKTYCLDHGEARIGWGKTGSLKVELKENEYYGTLGATDKRTLRYFAEEVVVGDILLCIHSASEIGSVGVVTSEYRFDESPPPPVHKDYKHVRQVKWLYRDVRLPIQPLNENRQFTLPTVYSMDRLTWGDLLAYLEKSGRKPVETQVLSAERKPYVLVIDEINRGNVSRIFGELITLVEASKREGAEEALSVDLPYSKKPFSVPDNVYLIGTMNTADRSLSGMDIALRRRFVFHEMLPQPSLLDKVVVGQVNVGALLEVMNSRIEALLDREHCLGHAYFMPLEKDPSLDRLSAIFRNQVMPLLQEYFFDDWQRIQWVLNDHRKAKGGLGPCFVYQRQRDVRALFGEEVDVSAQQLPWCLNDEAFDRLDAYLGIIDHELAAVPTAAVREATFKDYLIRQLTGGTIEVSCKSVREQFAKPALRLIASEIGVSLVNGNGNESNTRALGKAVLDRLITLRA